MRPGRRAAGVSAALLLLLAFSPASGPARAAEGDLSIDVHWFDAVQADDHATMAITETYFFNNSGTSAFSGNLSFPIPIGAQVASRACGGAADRAARLSGAAETHCFPLQDLGGGVRHGNPFNGTPMSFYGQRGVLTLQADSSLGDVAVLVLNVTAGAVPDGQATPPPAGPGLHLTANATELGGLSPAPGVLPIDLIFEGNVTVRNNRTEAAAVNLTASLAAPWAAAILDGTAPLASPLVLPPNATKELVVRVVVPNYLIEVQVDYTARMPSSGDRRWSLSMEYLYPVRDAQFFLFVLESDNATGDAPQAGSFLLVHGAPTWQDAMGRWWFFFIAEDLPEGARVDFAVFGERGDALLPLAVGLLAVLGVSLLGVVLYRRRRRRGSADGEEEAPAPESHETAAKTAPVVEPPGSSTAAGIERHREALRRVERDHELGRLPDDSYERLRARYEEGIRGARADAPRSAEIAEVEERRRRVVEAIRNLRAERAAGSVDPEVAQELEASYRAEAVALMRRLDELRK